MKAPDPCERWELRSGEEIIERLLARSARASNKQPNKPEDQSSKQQPEQRSYHYLAAANHFSRRADVRPKVPTRIMERRKAAIAAAARAMMVTTRKSR